MQTYTTVNGIARLDAIYSGKLCKMNVKDISDTLPNVY